MSTPGALCRGQRFKIETRESELRVEKAGVVIEERESDVDVRLPREQRVEPVAETRPAVPDAADVDEWARLGFETHQEESIELHETPTSRHETREEETDVEGEGFDYESKESYEEIDEPDFHSEEEESEEEFEARG